MVFTRGERARCGRDFQSRSGQLNMAAVIWVSVVRHVAAFGLTLFGERVWVREQEAMH